MYWEPGQTSEMEFWCEIAPYGKVQFLFLKNVLLVLTKKITKILLLQAYLTQHNYDIICLTEAFPNSFIESDDN